MKKPGYMIILFAINFVIYYYLIKYNEVNITYEEILMTLVASSIVIPLFTFIPALFSYFLNLMIHKVYVPFKRIYLNIYLTVSIAFYATMILIALLVYFKVK
jgi:hypothetical protein